MSHLAHTNAIRSQVRQHWILAASALFALLATTAVVLVLAIDSDSVATSATNSTGSPAVRTDGGPSESAVAASVGSRPSAGPDESRTAAAVGAASERRDDGPSESRVAATVGTD
jgi:hypothetical protein